MGVVYFSIIPTFEPSRYCKCWIVCFYYIYLTAEEQSRVIQSLIRLKNELLEQGRYTDAVDDVLCKVLAAKKKHNLFI